jgi:hypothetical protein
VSHLQQKPSIFPRWHKMYDVFLQFTSQSLLPSHRVGILDNILQSACYLTSLTAHWSDVLNVFKNNIRTYPRINVFTYCYYSDEIGMMMLMSM